MQQNFYLKKFAVEILFDAADFICITEFYLMQQIFNAAESFFNVTDFIWSKNLYCKEDFYLMLYITSSK